MRKKLPYEEPKIEVTFFLRPISTDIFTVSPPKHITDEDGNATEWDEFG